LRVSALTPEEEEKITNIEPQAQVNRIEHIFLNEEELNIKTVKNLPKSVNIELNEFTDSEKEKLSAIESGA
jgi:ABC-type proline/glycine betaine transport system substrate-binding protein